jgi:hypothetical protein
MQATLVDGQICWLGGVCWWMLVAWWLGLLSWDAMGAPAWIPHQLRQGTLVSLERIGQHLRSTDGRRVFADRWYTDGYWWPGVMLPCDTCMCY